MRARVKRELSRSWPVVGIAVVLWIATVVLRTPAAGLSPQRFLAIAITSGSMFALGLMYERLRKINEEDKEAGKP